MSTARITTVAEIAGLSIQGIASREKSGGVALDPALPAAVVAALTTRTDNNTGVVTLPANHGIVNGKIDLYWAGGVRYGMDGIVTINALAIDLGAGDNLPDDESAVIVSNQVAIDVDVDGDLLAALAAACPTRAHLDFQDDADASLLAVEIAAGEVYEWHADSEVTNPLAGDVVASLKASNGEATAATLKVGILYDSTG